MKQAMRTRYTFLYPDGNLVAWGDDSEWARKVREAIALGRFGDDPKITEHRERVMFVTNRKAGAVR